MSAYFIDTVHESVELRLHRCAEFGDVEEVERG